MIKKVKYLMILPMFISVNKVNSQLTWQNEFIGSDTSLLFFPDANINYWTFTFKNNKNYVFKISGNNPKVRYFSFNIYNDKNRASTGSLVDTDILSNDSYTIYIAPQGNNDYKDQNVLYYDKKGRTSTVFLRYYLPQVDNYGAAKLPKIEIVGKNTLNSKVVPTFNILGAKKLYKIAEKIIEKKANSFYNNYSKDSISAYKTKGKGYYENFDNSYLSIPIIRKDTNEVAILKFKPPSFSTNQNDFSKSVRYWSFGVSNAKSFNFFTLHDQNCKVHEDGFIYILVSDTPLSNTKTTYNHIPWATPNKNKLLLVYRNLLPQNHFNYSLENIPENQNAFEYIGLYSPSGKLITKNEFIKNGFQQIISPIEE